MPEFLQGLVFAQAFYESKLLCDLIITDRFLCPTNIRWIIKENWANSRGQGVCFRVIFFKKSKNVELVEEGRSCCWYRIRWREWYGSSLLHDTDIWVVRLSPNSIKTLQKSWWKWLESTYKSKTDEFECPDHFFFRDEQKHHQKWARNKKNTRIQVVELGKCMEIHHPNRSQFSVTFADVRKKPMI